MDLGDGTNQKHRVAFLPEMGAEIADLTNKLSPTSLEIIPIPAATSEEEVVDTLLNVRFVMGFLLPLAPAVVKAMSNISLVQLLTTGYDHFNIHDLLRAGVRVAHTGGSNARSVAEHTLLLMLALMRKLTLLHQNVISGRWRDDTPSVLKFQELTHKTIGVLGLGRVGREVVSLLRGFDTTVFYYDRFGPFPALEEGLGASFLELEEMLARADVLTIHIPLISSTHHLIDKSKLDLMKTGAVLINTSRGKIVDEAALLKCLAEGRIAGVGLDVFSEEPLPSGHPLLSFCDRVVLTPHRAGSTEQSWDRRLRNAFRNIERVCAGLPPLWTIDLIQPS